MIIRYGSRACAELGAHLLIYASLKCFVKFVDWFEDPNRILINLINLTRANIIAILLNVADAPDGGNNKYNTE